MSLYSQIEIAQAEDSTIISADCTKLNNRIKNLAKNADFDLTIYQNLADHCPKEFELWYNYAILLNTKKKYSEAKEVFERALTIKSDQEAELGLAFVQINLGDINDAKVKFENILKISPDNVRALQGSAQCFVKENKLDQAYAQIQKSLVIDPENPTSYYNLAAIENLRENYDQSIQALQKTLELSPNYESAALQLALLYRQKGKFREAIAACKRSLTDQNNFFSANLLMANLYLDLKDNAQSIYWFKKALKLNKKDVFAILGLAEAYNNDQQSSAALELLSEHSEIKPLAPFEYLKTIGKVYMSLGKFYQAKGVLEEALVLQPKDTEIKGMLDDVAFKER
jgi:tetratricopeptide (TPR) repeat protein